MLKPLMAAAAAAITVTAMADTHQASPSGEQADRFADIEVIRYDVPGFADLSLQQKKFIYYLAEAALWGRDILWDQNGRYNLPLRSLLEALYTNYQGPQEDSEYQAFLKYLKQTEFGSGAYHHYSTDKFAPGFSRRWFDRQVSLLPREVVRRVLTAPGAAAAAIDGETFDMPTLTRLVFDPKFLPKRVNQAAGADVVATSANNLYDGQVNQAEVEAFYGAMKDTTDLTPVSYGLNARVGRDPQGCLREEVYRQGGLYGPAIDRIVQNLELALPLAETPRQQRVVQRLIDYYRSGDLRAFDEYSILWAEDTEPRVDFVNGFIESYGDPLGMTGAWESIVNFKNEASTARTVTLSDNAQWFEDRSPVDARFRKPRVKGVSAKVINAAILAGDAYPAPPIGINLPNSNWIRAAHGSKSVNIENLVQAYDDASHGNGFNEEFVIDEPTRQNMDKYLFTADNLHTDLHECLGHGSGQLLAGVDPDALKEHGSTLEETRADLFALYFLADPKLVELGISPDPEAYKAEYYKYLLNGLMTQLLRIEPGHDIEEAHMRNRQLIARWAYEHGLPDKVVELVKKEGKTYVQINDYQALRGLFGQLLGEIQRIKSEGDYAAGAALVEQYAVKVDPALHSEVLSRYATLDIAPYRGFVNPVYTAVRDGQGNITDIILDFTEGYLPQHMRYSADYSPLTHQ